MSHLFLPIQHLAAQKTQDFDLGPDPELHFKSHRCTKCHRQVGEMQRHSLVLYSPSSTVGNQAEFLVKPTLQGAISDSTQGSFFLLFPSQKKT